MSRPNANRFSVLARLLAAGVLVFSLLAASGTFHEAVHHEGDAASATCIFCLLAKGQVESPQSLPTITALVSLTLVWAPLVESSAPAQFTYLSSPSRAPPACLSLLSVLA